MLYKCTKIHFLYYKKTTLPVSTALEDATGPIVDSIRVSAISDVTS